MSMRKLKILAISSALWALLAGCAGPSVRYAEQNKPLAEQGKIKWSEYYKGLYDTALRAGESGQMLMRINTMIMAAQSYETGKLSRDQFEYFRRQAQAGQAVDDETADMQRRAAFAAAAKSFNTSMSAPQLPTQLAPIQPARVAPLQVTPAPAASASAYFTGRQEQVQTVTYQAGWNCEYRYLSQTFWRTFVGTCPSSIQVQ